MMARVIIALLTAISLVMAQLAGPAAANGAPVTVVLGYLEGVSNWGPSDATGVAEVVLREEEVYVEINGLPRLTGEAYEVWLANTAGGDWLSVGRFNPDDASYAQLDEDITLPPGSPEHPYDLVVISVEPEPDDSPAPSQRLSLAGYFPGTHETPVPSATSVGPFPTSTPVRGASFEGTPAATSVGTPGAVGTPGLAPNKLPRTGEPASTLWLLALAGSLLMAGGLVQATLVSRAAATRKRRQ